MSSRRRWDASMTAMLSGLRRISMYDRRDVICNAMQGSCYRVFKLLLIDVFAAVHALKGKKKNRCGDTRGLGIEARLDSEVADDRISQLKPMIMQISGMVSVVKDLA
ncbi:hypothetical protein BELL_0026g00140 [Botrytis elliptica]|uniref:Uncharacterized protein n=1 Tax=Botrytis elliptica TaxID=278938 RepID=A0A4Z1K0D1_9HELO|nr:hypothetical protein BELL_0026g00140 [Botrytis elliptica]